MTCDEIETKFETQQKNIQYNGSCEVECTQTCLVRDNQSVGRGEKNLKIYKMWKKQSFTIIQCNNGAFFEK